MFGAEVTAAEVRLDQASPNAGAFTWSGTSDLAVATLDNGVKVAVKFGAEVIEVQTVFQRLNRCEQGDDLPIVMRAFGVDYDAACDAVFNGRFDVAKTLLGAAVGTSEKAMDVRQQPSLNTNRTEASEIVAVVQSPAPRQDESPSP